MSENVFSLAFVYSFIYSSLSLINVSGMDKLRDSGNKLNKSTVLKKYSILVNYRSKTCTFLIPYFVKSWKEF